MFVIFAIIFLTVLWTFADRFGVGMGLGLCALVAVLLVALMFRRRPRG